MSIFKVVGNGVLVISFDEGINEEEGECLSFLDELIDFCLRSTVRIITRKEATFGYLYLQIAFHFCGVGTLYLVFQVLWQTRPLFSVGIKILRNLFRSIPLLFLTGLQIY